MYSMLHGATRGELKLYFDTTTSGGFSTAGKPDDRLPAKGERGQSKVLHHEESRLNFN